MLDEPIHHRLLAILFASPDPVTITQLAAVFTDVPTDQLRTSLEKLAVEFSAIQSAVEIRPMAGGYRMTTRPEHHEVIREYLKTKPSSKLSLAALETLAVIAYRQPVTLPEISEIRGVRGYTTIRNLLEKKLVETRGRKKTVGRPIQYGTTREFLVHFGLNDLSELPTLKELDELLDHPEDPGKAGTQEKAQGDLKFEQAP